MTPTPTSVARQPPRFDAAPLRHPLWWAALALLLVNDNLLKGRGLVPGWLTGKLSDFAFLIVAPVLAAALLPRALRGRRTLAVAAVTGLFVAADLSRAASDGVVAAAAHLGLRWRLWPDVSDLVALAVLPLTIWLMRRPSPAPSGVSPARTCVRHWREGAGVVIGAAACLATSAQLDRHSPFLVNRSSAAADLRITWLLRQVDCQTTAEALASALTSGDLDEPRALTLARGQGAALDGVPPAGPSPASSCSNPRNSGECVGAVLEVDGADPVLMVARRDWHASGASPFSSCSCQAGRGPESPCKAILDPERDPGPDGISLLDTQGRRRFEITSPARAANPQVAIAPIDLAALAARIVPPDSCRSTRDAYHQLGAANTCQTRADCRAIARFDLPGDAPSMCTLLVNAGAADMLGALLEHWQMSCVGGSTCYGASLAHPIDCVAGTCAPICTTTYLPPCPLSCRRYGISASSPGTSCAINLSCALDDGRWCVCDGGVVTCAAAPTAKPDCPYVCTMPNGDPAAMAIDPDAGPRGIVDAATDAGAPDAGAADTD